MIAAMANPIQQGLKLVSRTVTGPGMKAAMANPIQQGLKLYRVSEHNTQSRRRNG